MNPRSLAWPIKGAQDEQQEGRSEHRPLGHLHGLLEASLAGSRVATLLHAAGHQETAAAT